MQKYLLLFLLFISCKEETNNIVFIPLNPPTEEFIPANSPYLDERFKNKICRADYFIINGFVKRDSIFDMKLDSIVTMLGEKYKNKYPSYSIHFYKLGGNIEINKKYELSALKEYIGKPQAISEVVFQFGKPYYFVYIEDEMILYDYIDRKDKKEIFE